MSNNSKKLTFITGNKHKFTEIKEVFKNENLDIKLENQNIKTIEIQSDSLEKVVEFKINSIKNKISGNFFVEDAGFFVDFLNGFPGVYSSYVMKAIGNKGILKLVGDSKIREANFKAIIALYVEEDNQIRIFKGEVLGMVAKKKGEIKVLALIRFSFLMKYLIEHSVSFL